MLSFYQEVAEANVQGLLAIQRDEHMEALNLFHQGLTRLLEGQQQSSSSTTDPTRTAEGTSASQIGKETKDTRLVVSVAMSDHNHHSTTFDEEVLSLFHRGLHIQFDKRVANSAGQDFYGCLTTTVMAFNVGLTHHISGLERGESCLLARALDFYSMAYTSLASRGRCLERIPLSANLCLMALANNIGHIHAHFRRLPLIIICKEEISLRLSTLANFNLYDDGLAGVNEEYRVFFLNISFFSESCLATAPAA